MAIPSKISRSPSLTSLHLTSFSLRTLRRQSVGPLLRGAMMMKTSILPQVVRSAAPSVRPSVRFFSILPIRVTRSRFHLRSVHFPALFSASPLSALRVRSVRPFIVFDQRCEMGSMIHSSLSWSSYVRLRNLLAQPEIILGAEMVARPLARIFCPKDLFMFYHS